MSLTRVGHKLLSMKIEYSKQLKAVELESKSAPSGYQQGILRGRKEILVTVLKDIEDLLKKVEG